MQKNTWLSITLLIMLTGCASNDQILTDNSQVITVEGDDAEIAQIETLITPVELIENDNESMRYRIRANGKYLFLEGTINSNFATKIKRPQHNVTSNAKAKKGAKAAFT